MLCNKNYPHNFFFVFLFHITCVHAQGVSEVAGISDVQAMKPEKVNHPYIHFQHQNKGIPGELHPEVNDTGLELLGKDLSYQRLEPTVVTGDKSFYQLDIDEFYRARAGSKIILTSSVDTQLCRETECRKDLVLPEKIELKCTSQDDDKDEHHALHRPDQVFAEAQKIMQFYFVYERDLVNKNLYLFIVIIKDGVVSIKRMQITRRQLSALKNELLSYDKALVVIPGKGGIVFVDRDYKTNLLNDQTGIAFVDLGRMPMVLEIDQEGELILWSPKQWHGFVQAALWQTVQRWLCCCCSEDEAARDTQYDSKDQRYFLRTQTARMKQLVERLKKHFNEKKDSEAFVEVILRVLGEENRASKVKRFVKTVLPDKGLIRVVERTEYDQNVFILTEAIAEFTEKYREEGKQGHILYFLDKLQEHRDRSAYEHRLTEQDWERLLDEAESSLGQQGK